MNSQVFSQDDLASLQIDLSDFATVALYDKAEDMGCPIIWISNKKGLQVNLKDLASITSDASTRPWLMTEYSSDQPDVELTQTYLSQNNHPNETVVDGLKEIGVEVYFSSEQVQRPNFEIVPFPVYKNEFPYSEEKAPFFLDRDGIINIDKGYTSRWEEVEWIPGIEKFLKYLQEEGQTPFVVTNQSGVGRGYYSESDVLKLHGQMEEWLKEKGIHICDWAYCPFHPKSGDDKYLGFSLKRKPFPGMLLELSKKYPLGLRNAFMIGDKVSDIIHLKGPQYFLLRGNYDLHGSTRPIFENFEQVQAELERRKGK